MTSAHSVQTNSFQTQAYMSFMKSLLYVLYIRSKQGGTDVQVNENVKVYRGLMEEGGEGGFLIG